tara:strand:+ start:675 stop:1517 length:843 start_codon:yes stop_codon:yes gene_type:complete
MSIGSMLFTQFLGGMAKRSTQRRDEAKEALREQEKFERQQGYINTTWENRQRFLSNMEEQKKTLAEEQETEKWIAQIAPFVDNDPQFAAKIYEQEGKEGIENFITSAKQFRASGVNIIDIVDGQKTINPIIYMPSISKQKETFTTIALDDSSPQDLKNTANIKLNQIYAIENIGKEQDDFSPSDAAGVFTLIDKELNVAARASGKVKFTMQNNISVPTIDDGYLKFLNTTGRKIILDTLPRFKKIPSNMHDLYVNAYLAPLNITQTTNFNPSNFGELVVE